MANYGQSEKLQIVKQRRTCLDCQNEETFPIPAVQNINKIFLIQIKWWETSVVNYKRKMRCMKSEEVLIHRHGTMHQFNQGELLLPIFTKLSKKRMPKKKKKMKPILFIPYSTNEVPCYDFLLPKLKFSLNGWKFRSKDDYINQKIRYFAENCYLLCMQVHCKALIIL